MKGLTVTAPAKINLHLQVLGSRGDGFHEVWTILQSIGLADVLTVEPDPGGAVMLSVEPGGVVPEGQENLVLRVASALRQRTGVDRGAKIHLLKRIPVGAGLGGGSADAAAALVALDRMWELNLDRATLAEVAAGIGSDVAFFLHGGLALGRGRGGDIIQLPDTFPRGVVVAAPKLQVSTPEAFAMLGRRLTSRRPDATVEAFVADKREAGTGDPPWGSLGNDFEGVVTERWPEIGRVTRAVRATAPLHAAITGSGAAVFGIYEDREAAHGAAQKIGNGMTVYAGSILGNRRAALLDRGCNPREEEKT